MKLKRLAAQIPRALIFLTLVMFVGRQPAKAQSNLVFNGSFESADAGWGWDGGSLEVVINNYQAYDGTSWLGPYGSLWQDLPTIPGRDYYVQFATKNGTSLRVNWGETNFTDITVSNPNLSSTTWVVTNAIFTASSNQTRLRFQANPSPFQVDGVEVRWLQEPVSITVPVPSRSTFEGGSASFPVTAIGAPTLRYQWYRDEIAIINATNRILTRTNLTMSDSGDYWVSITNNYGAATSLRARLIINPMPEVPLIVSQPKSQTTVEGYAAAFHVVAFGSPTLNYQWRLNGTNIATATNSSFQISAVTAPHAGDYSVVVSNTFGGAQSITATLHTLPAGSGGGSIVMANRQAAMIDSPIFDSNGTTRLAGSNYVAQLYAGISPLNLHAVGSLNHFRTGNAAGYFFLATRTIPDAPFGSTIYAQIRVWDYTTGKSFEEAQARGGRFGKSKVTSLIVLDPFVNPPLVVDFKSFALEAGMSPLATAKLELGAQQPGGDFEWLLIGDPGYNYVVESKTPPNDWTPILVLTNTTGATSFVDTNGLDASLKYYRARIIEP